MIRTALSTIAFLASGWAQLRVPIAGYAVEAGSTRVRPIIGAAGAALIGDSVSTIEGASLIAISPDQQRAIISTDHVFIAPLGPDGLGDGTAIEGAGFAPDRVEFSSDGSVAVLYFAALNKLQVVTSLSGTPQISRELSVARDLLAIAVSRDGAALLCAESQGNVVLLTSDGMSRLIWSGDPIVALQFLPDGSRAVAVDSARSQVLSISGLPDASSVQVIADGQMGVDSPSAVQVTADGRRALVANSGGSNVLKLNLDTGDAVSMDCTCRPASLRPLLNGGFLLSDQDSGSFWMLDPSLLRLAFIPKLAEP